MEISEKAIDVLNNLIEINNDRVEGFQKAGKDLEEEHVGLTAVFNKLAGESQQNAIELTHIVQQYGIEAAEGTSTAGALHRTWLDIKAVFTGGDIESILNECERGEDAIKAAYKTALEPDSELSPELVPIVQQQALGVNEGHYLIKSLRSQFAVINEVKDNAEKDTATAATPVYEQGAVADNYYENTAGENQQPTTIVPEHQSFDQDNAWEEEETSTANSKLMEFFINELKDLLWAEQELLDTLPNMAEAATSAELKMAFENHLVETETHVTRLEQIFGVLGLEPDARKCQAMAGIVDEGDEIISATEEGTAQRDVGLIFAAQKAEHYEIASYGGMISLAKTLGYYDIAETLVLTLDEEKSADALLTEIAENSANPEAANEPSED